MIHEWGRKIGEPHHIPGAILYLAFDFTYFATRSSVVFDGSRVAW